MQQIKQYFQKHSKNNNLPIVFASKAMDIPIEITPDNDPRKKKLRNNLKRKKNKQRKQQTTK